MKRLGGVKELKTRGEPSVSNSIPKTRSANGFKIKVLMLLY